MTEEQSDLYDKAFYDQQSQGSLTSAQIVLRKVLDLMPIQSAIDVGCGVAPWLRTALELGASKGVAVDGDYVDRNRLLVSRALFRACNLEDNSLVSAVGEGEEFDLVVCMEVAEHLSDARADSFISELGTLGDLVLFSAAIPGQGGVNHINEQWPSYWSLKFAQQGFDCFDFLRESLWYEDACEWWYLQNVMLFVKKGSQAHMVISDVHRPKAEPLALVHPRMLRHTVDYMQERISMLEKMASYQPFGRDEAIRMLEARTDAMRLTALRKGVEVETANALLAAQHVVSKAHRDAETELSRQLAATLASTSWRITKPLRWIARNTGLFRRGL